MAYRCDGCGKKRLIARKVAHKPGVAGTQWKKRAPKTRKVSLPNLHTYKGQRFCTKCLRRVKKPVSKTTVSRKPTQE